jgi:hypothetical protein
VAWVRDPVLGWRDDPWTPLFDDLWRETMGDHDVPDEHNGTGEGLVESPVHYAYTDPVDDDDWPGITAHDPETVVDFFPETWGEEPTERDQAAIDAGNA